MGLTLILTNVSKKIIPGTAAERRVIYSGFGLAAVLLVVDQVTKALVVHHIPLHEKISVIPGFFYLTYITNKGAAWGILQGRGWLLLAVALFVLVMMLAFLRWLTEGRIERYFCMAMIFSGIIGNSIDRIWRREVVDFLDFIVLPSFRNGSFSLVSWPAFNVADAAICVGVTIYFLSVYLKPEGKNAVPDKPADAKPCKKTDESDS